MKTDRGQFFYNKKNYWWKIDGNGKLRVNNTGGFLFEITYKGGTVQDYIDEHLNKMQMGSETILFPVKTVYVKYQEPEENWNQDYPV